MNYIEPLKVGDWLVEPNLNQIRGDTDEISLRPQTMDMLVYLANNNGQVVSAERLIEDVWQGVTVNSGSVYNCINELRQAFGDSKQAHAYIETIPKRGYRLVAPTSGIPVTPAPMITENDASIAVLPFVNFSSDQEQEYFSDGISEELLNVLAQIPRLQVAARVSSFQFKGENRDITDIGKQLNVSHILEGSVRKSGYQVRITAQLIDAKNGFHLWSESYDRSLDNVFAIQDEISQAIVKALIKRLDIDVAIPARDITTDIEVYDACLRGKYLMAKRRRNSIEAGVEEFKAAIAIEPDYAPAHAELAIAMQSLSRNHNGMIPHAEATDQALGYAKKALELDPCLAESHAAMGFVAWNQERLEDSLEHFQNALAINANYAMVYDWIGMLLGNELGPWEGNDMGRYAEAFAARERSIRLDPLSLPANNNYIIGLIMRNRALDAEKEMIKLKTISPPCYENKKGVQSSLNGGWANIVLASLKTIKIDPEYYWVRNQLAFTFAALGLEHEAFTISQTPPCCIYNILGQPDKAVTLAKSFYEKEPDSILDKRNLGLALAGVGDYVRAKPILEEIWRRNGKRVTAFGLFQNACAAALIAMRCKAGDERGVNELLSALRENVSSYKAAGIVEKTCFFNADYEEGLTAFLTGDKPEGLAMIAKAVDNGYFILPKETYLEVLYQHPDFPAIREKQEAHQASQRESFLAAIHPENPYVAIWQPTQETKGLFL